MNIFVAGLSYQLSEADLQELFEEFGEVTSAKIIMDRVTGRSKGYGFVEMDDAAGQQAIDELDGAEFAGRRLAVSVARPRREHNDRPRYNRGGGYDNRDRGY